MIARPLEVSPELQTAVDSGKKITFHYSPNTKIVVVTTDAAEAQQILEACQPVEAQAQAAHIREEAQWALLLAYYQEPVETMEWLIHLKELMEDT